MDAYRRLRTIALVLAVVVLPAGRASAAALLIEEVGILRGDLTARVRLVDLLDARARSDVASGLPVTVRFATDLWRDRRRWFDEHVDAHVESYRIRWDPRDRLYTLAHPGPGGRVDTYERLDDLLADLQSRDVVIHPRWALDDRSRYFAIVEVAVRPLTLEEFRELEGWVGGKIRGTEEPGDAPGSGEDGEGVSGAVLDFLLGMAGFGDLILEERTPAFRPGDLRELALPAEGSGPDPAPAGEFPADGDSDPSEGP